MTAWSDADLDALVQRGHVRVVPGAEHARPRALPRPLLTAADLVSEQRFMAAVIRAAEAQHYSAYHTYRSTRSAPGFPDLVLAKIGEPLRLWELKTNAGRTSQTQEAWLALLAQTERPQVGLYTPADFQRCLSLLGYA